MEKRQTTWDKKKKNKTIVRANKLHRNSMGFRDKSIETKHNVWNKKQIQEFFGARGLGFVSGSSPNLYTRIYSQQNCSLTQLLLYDCLFNLSFQAEFDFFFLFFFLFVNVVVAVVAVLRLLSPIFTNKERT